MNDDHLMFRGKQFVGEDFSRRSLSMFTSVGSRFESCRFDNMRIKQASLGSGGEVSEYVNCVFDGARMTFGPGGFASYVNCSFRDVRLREWICFNVEMVNCVFTGQLKGAIFNGTVRPQDVPRANRKTNKFYGNDFSGMELIDVAFRTDIDLSKQRLPTGPQYLYIEDAVSAVMRARAEITMWTDLELRKNALAFLRALQFDINGGQRQLLLRADDYERKSRREVEAVLALLQK